MLLDEMLYIVLTLYLWPVSRHYHGVTVEHWSVIMPIILTCNVSSTTQLLLKGRPPICTIIHLIPALFLQSMGESLQNVNENSTTSLSKI